MSESVSSNVFLGDNGILQGFTVPPDLEAEFKVMDLRSFDARIGFALRTLQHELGKISFSRAVAVPDFRDFVIANTELPNFDSSRLLRVIVSEEAPESGDKDLGLSTRAVKDCFINRDGQPGERVAVFRSTYDYIPSWEGIDPREELDSSAVPRIAFRYENKPPLKIIIGSDYDADVKAKVARMFGNMPEDELIIDITQAAGGYDPIDFIASDKPDVQYITTRR